MATETVRGTGVQGVGLAAAGLTVADLATSWVITVVPTLPITVPAGVLTWIAVGVAAWWTVRARRNADEMAPGSQRVSTVWAVVATLLPIVGVVLLPRVHTDLWGAMDRSPSRVTPVPVALWWTGMFGWCVLGVVIILMWPGGSRGAEPPSVVVAADVALQTLWLGGFAWWVLRVSGRQEAWRRRPA